MDKKKILIIGGGASGMMAAIFAAESGAFVNLAERNNRLGKKVLVTGNGRCNLTNLNISHESYHGNNPLFTNNVFGQFNIEDTISFFNTLGLVTKVEEKGRVFPMSDQASSVVDLLTHKIKDLGVKVLYETKVENLERDNDGFKALLNGKEHSFDKVIIATGGKAVPALGSDGFGYELAQNLGHTITPVWPSLVQLKLKGDFFEEIKGVKIDGMASFLVDGKVIKKETGEILFTHYGVSGPAILKLSREVKKQILNGKKAKLRISLFNNFTEDTLDKFLEERFRLLNKKLLKTSFLGFMQKRLIIPLLKEANVNEDKKCAEVKTKERKRLVNIVLGWEFEVIDTNSFKNAQVTAGGVDTEEINSKTLESKKVPGLYFCGEILDIDGDSGGFNLQFAWSTGAIAGENSAN